MLQNVIVYQLTVITIKSI